MNTSSLSGPEGRSRRPMNDVKKQSLRGTVDMMVHETSSLSGRRLWVNMMDPNELKMSDRTESIRLVIEFYFLFTKRKRTTKNSIKVGRVGVGWRRTEKLNNRSQIKETGPYDWWIVLTEVKEHISRLRIFFPLSHTHSLVLVSLRTSGVPFIRTVRGILSPFISRDRCHS